MNAGDFTKASDLVLCDVLIKKLERHKIRLAHIKQIKKILIKCDCKPGVSTEWETLPTVRKPGRSIH